MGDTRTTSGQKPLETATARKSKLRRILNLPPFSYVDWSRWPFHQIAEICLCQWLCDDDQLCGSAFADRGTRCRDLAHIRRCRQSWRYPAEA